MLGTEPSKPGGNSEPSGKSLDHWRNALGDVLALFVLLCNPPADT